MHDDLLHLPSFTRRHFAELLHKLLATRVRMLVVVDVEIDFDASPSSFGIGRVVRLLRESSVGCVVFGVDIAQRSSGPFVDRGSAAADPRYTGFRFDSRLADGSLAIEQYDEIWCFGFKPHAAFFPPTSDSDITAPGALPASDDELARLTTWMNAGGGLFGTGDHDFLGAPMCHRIPRLGTMRAWTNAQKVPPINGTGRLDTNRPFNAAERAGNEVIEIARERDTLPQPIEWVTWLSHAHPWLHRARLVRPHPVLCHPELGPIDVMPDHPHEGVVFDHVPQPDLGLPKIQLGGRYNFAGVAGDEYPDVGGVRPLPMVIAHGRTLSDPPLQHDKGRIAAKRFGMISVYDGHAVSVGRVATDSTWHHWFNLNISQIEAAGGDDWRKISRYYLNLATWLAPRTLPRRCLQFHLAEAFYTYPGIEELGPRQSIFEAGPIVRDRLVRLYGPCWVTQLVFDWIFEVEPGLRKPFLDRYLAVPWPKRPFPPRPEPCLSCPHPELFEIAVLGSLSLSLADTLFADGGGLEAGLERLGRLDTGRLDRQMHEAVARGLAGLRAELRSSMKRNSALLAKG